MKVNTKRIPDSKRIRKFKNAAQKVREDFEKLSSTEHAESMVAEDFQVRPIYPEKGLPIKLQMAQIRGKLEQEEDYGSAEYFQLIKQIVPLRTSFSKTKDHDVKREIAGEEIKAWLGFLEARKEMLKD